ncbi:MAG: hypothetical protein JST27_05700 [Bacteroidetes bacterium]|nr:hypothetical protein [Bacteroidota bacterium]
MSKKSKGSGGNILLLAGLGVGAALLFANKSNAQSNSSASELPSGSVSTDIPDAPKILAVNSSSTESPTPTGIVSDEEGMETVSSSSSGSNRDDDSGGGSVVETISNTGVKLVKQFTEDKDIPPLVSTKLTPKETAIINSGKLTAALALQRPDLYKAAYIKKYGGKTATGKKKALAAATLAIDAAVTAANAAKSGGLVKAGKYPAKPQFTFVQTAGGMAAQAAVAQMAELQKAGVKVSPAAQKISAQVKAAKGSKGRHPVKHTPAKSAHPSKKKAVKRAVRPASKKRVVKKRH